MLNNTVVNNDNIVITINILLIIICNGFSNLFSEAITKEQDHTRVDHHAQNVQKRQELVQGTCVVSILNA